MHLTMTITGSTAERCVTPTTTNTVSILEHKDEVTRGACRTKRLIMERYDEPYGRLS